MILYSVLLIIVINNTTMYTQPMADMATCQTAAKELQNLYRTQAACIRVQ